MGDRPGEEAGDQLGHRDIAPGGEPHHGMVERVRQINGGLHTGIESPAYETLMRGP